MSTGINKIKSFIKRSNFKKTTIFFILAFVVLVFPKSVNAGVTEWASAKILLGLANLLYAIVAFLGKFAVYLIGWVGQVAAWNNFINVKTVEIGWSIVRDLCNMFFILILLVIAFGTILRIESYNWKKMLPKLLLMAVLINFSKTICGLIIDFAQVIMLTFISSISTGTNNFVELLGVKNLLTFAESKNASNSDAGLAMDTVWALLLGLIFMIVTLIVLAVLLATLVFRVMMLWVYIILSPLAYLLSAFPQGQKYAAQWWSEFTKNVITGPILAFFLWLALATVSTSSITITNTNTNTLTQGASSTSGIISGLLDGDTFQTYIITISLLIGGLIVTQQAGGIAGSMAGKGLGWAKKMGGAAVAGTGAAVLMSSRAARRTTLRGVGAGVGAIGKGADEGSIRASIGKVGAAANAWGNDMRTARLKEKAKNRQKTLEKLGMGEGAMEGITKMKEDKNIKRATGIAKGAVAGAAIAATGGLGLAGAAGGGGLGYAYQKARELIGGKAESWSQKKIDKRNQDLEKFTTPRDNEIAQSEQQQNQEIRSSENQHIDRISDLKKGTTEGIAFDNAQAAYSEFTADDGNARRDYIRYQESVHGHSRAEAEKKADLRKEELGANLDRAGYNFNNLAEVKAADQEHKLRVDQSKTEHSARTETINKDFQGQIKAAGLDKQIAAGMQTGLRDFGKNLKNYNPNHITFEAAKLGTEQIRAAGDRRQKLATDSANIEDFQAEHLYSPSGITSGQQKFYDKISDGSKEAADAINNMAKSLAKFSSGLQRPSTDQQKNLVALKQLIASQIAAGKSTDHLVGVIGHLDKINTGDKKDRIKVEEFVEKKSA